MNDDKEQVVTQLLALAKSVAAFRSSLSAETDRGCALMAASYLESQLEQLVKAHLVPGSKVVSALFENSGPLGTFSARVDLAFALGLLDVNTHRELHLVRRIRNEFGHSYDPISFQTERIMNRCNELKRIPRDSERPRHVFTRTVMGLLAAIHARLTRATQPQIPADHLTHQNKRSVEIEVKKVTAYFDEVDADTLREVLRSSDNPVWDILQGYFNSKAVREIGDSFREGSHKSKKL
jgi:DNA-binding MltR family transcriptional regulator